MKIKKVGKIFARILLTCYSYLVRELEMSDQASIAELNEVVKLNGVRRGIIELQTPGAQKGYNLIGVEARLSVSPSEFVEDEAERLANEGLTIIKQCTSQQGNYGGVAWQRRPI